MSFNWGFFIGIIGFIVTALLIVGLCRMSDKHKKAQEVKKINKLVYRKHYGCYVAHKIHRFNGATYASIRSNYGENEYYYLTATRNSHKTRWWKVVTHERFNEYIRGANNTQEIFRIWKQSQTQHLKSYQLKKLLNRNVDVNSPIKLSWKKNF